jgi:hypothetical protein
MGALKGSDGDVEQTQTNAWHGEALMQRPHARERKVTGCGHSGGGMCRRQANADPLATAATRCLYILAWASLLCLVHKQCASDAETRILFQ